MRVTKTIREFVEREVSARLAPKYEAEKQEAKRQNDIEQKVWEDAMTAAQEAYDKFMAKAFTDYDFLENLHNDDRRCVELRKHCAFAIKDRQSYTSVHCWQRRMAAEAKKICDEIIVGLELGGTKEELMKMLDKVGRV